MTTIGVSDARNLALKAQGFGPQRTVGRDVTSDDIRRVFDRVKLVQIDSVSALIRTQYLPFFSRLGPYPLSVLHEYAFEQRRTFEYWIHEACMAPVEHYPIFRYRMRQWVAENRWERFLEEHPNFESDIVEEIERRGPLSVSDLDMTGPRIGYWSASPGKMALYHLHRSGRLMISDRYKPAPTYDLIERVVPEERLAAREPSLEAVYREMVLLAVDALGLATFADIADYYRVRRGEMKQAVDDLVSTGELEQVAVDGCEHVCHAAPGWETGLTQVSARALLSPFDSLVWTRRRIDWLFDFHYRIEIYTPAKKRQYGYYVLPFLLGNSLVARVDLKCDRKAKVLRVPGAFLEEGADADRVAHELALELHMMAEWLGMERVVVGRRGGLVSALRSAVKSGAQSG